MFGGRSTYGCGAPMLDLPPFPPSRPVLIVPYRPSWETEFAALAERLRALVGSAAGRLDHIGSTAVPGLCAKDVLDVQLTVPSFEAAEAWLGPLRHAGFQRGQDWIYDLFHGLPLDSPELRKRYLREPPGERRLHLHVREQGRLNTRFALLFRDYLRAEPAACAEYGLFKQRAAALFPTSIDGYLYLKEPVFHLVYQAAEQWAAAAGWQAPSSCSPSLHSSSSYEIR